MYRNEAGRFELAMPGTPTTEELENKLVGTTHLASVKVGEVTYYAMWVDFPIGMAVNVPGAFDGAQNNICKQDDVTVTSSRELTFDGGAPERDVVAESTSRKPWKDEMRFIYVAPRLYTLLVRGVTDEAPAKAYLQSFRVLPSVASEAAWTLGTLGPATASFPATPKEAKSMQQGPEGPMEVRTLRLTRGGIDMGLQLTVDPKPGPEADADIEVRLDAVRDTLMHGLGATRVTLDEKRSRGGLHTRRVALDLGKGRGTTEIEIAFPKKDTLVMAMVVLTDPHTDAEKADGKRFLDSFAPAAAK